MHVIKNYIIKNYIIGFIFDHKVLIILFMTCISILLVKFKIKF